MILVAVLFGLAFLTYVGLVFLVQEWMAKRKRDQRFGKDRL